MKTSTSRAVRGGMVMPLVLIALAISMILGMSFLAASSTTSATSAAASDRLNARMIAESGIGVALAQIDAEQAWRTARPNGTWVAQQALGGGTFSIDVVDGEVNAAGAVVGDGSLSDDDQDPVVITCIGTFGGARHRVRAVRRVPPPSGIAVAERMSLKRTALVDSYNTSSPYVASSAGSNAVATSNGLSRGTSLILRNNARVLGNAYFGPGGSLIRSVQMDPTALVTGMITALPGEVELPDVVEPSWSGPNNGPLTYSGGVTLWTGDIRCKGLTLNGTAKLRVVGNVSALVDGDCVLTDSSSIELGRALAFGAVTKSTILVEKSTVVDSYDSSVGAYGGGNRGAAAKFVTNAITAGSITITDGGTVRGDAVSGAGSIPAVAINTADGTLTGTKSALTGAITVPAPPAWPTGLGASTGDFNAQDVTAPVNSNLHCENFKVTGNGIVRVSGHRVFRVNGSFLIDGNGQLDIQNNSSLTIYVGGQIRIGGNGVAANATTKDPSRLVMYSMGTGQAHEFTANAIFHGIFDSPNSPLRVMGNTQFFGTIMAQSLVITDSSLYHHDRSPNLVDANPRLPVMGYTPGNRLVLYVRDRLLVDRFAKVNVSTADAANVAIFNRGPVPMEVRDDASGYANVCVPDATFSMAGNSRWTGRIRARDAIISGTAAVTTDASGGTSQPGLLVEETVELTDSAVVSGTGGLAVLATNSWNESTIRLHDTSTFKGSVWTAPDGVPSDEIRVAPTATLTGTAGKQTTAANIYAMTSPAVVGPVTDRCYDGTTTTVITGDVYCHDFTIADSAIVEVDGTCRLIMTGQFKMSGTAQLRLLPSAKLTVYCPGRVQVFGSARANGDGLPKCLVFHCAATSPRVDVRDDAELFAVVHGADAELLLSDTAEFFGAFNGRRVKVDDGAKIHCGEATDAPITWLEQQ